MELALLKEEIALQDKDRDKDTQVIMKLQEEITTLKKQMDDLKTVVQFAVNSPHYFYPPRGADGLDLVRLLKRALKEIEATK